MEIRFRFDPERLTVAEYIAIDDLMQDDGQLTPANVRAVRDYLACFMVGADGQELDKKEAKAQLDQLTLDGLSECIRAFTEQRSRDVDEAVLPNENDAG